MRRGSSSSMRGASWSKGGTRISSRPGAATGRCSGVSNSRMRSKTKPIRHKGWPPVDRRLYNSAMNPVESSITAEHRVVQLEEALNEAAHVNAELQSRDALKTQFLANISDRKSVV